MPYVEANKADQFLAKFPDNSIDLLLTDPPFFGIVKDAWDNQWKTEREFATWLSALFLQALPKLTPRGSLVFFGATGRHKCHPLFRIITALEDGGYTFRNWVTWKKRRGYGKSHDYLYIREEILWFSRSPVRTEVNFHKPLTKEIRGYDGFNKNYKAHSEFKRVGNVMNDITEGKDPIANLAPEWVDPPLVEDISELFRPERSCQKPPRLMERLVHTHSSRGQLVVDPFCGWGTTGVAAVKMDREFRGCEMIPADAEAANQRVLHAKENNGWDDPSVLELFGVPKAD